MLFCAAASEALAAWHPEPAAQQRAVLPQLQRARAGGRPHRHAHLWGPVWRGRLLAHLRGACQSAAELARPWRALVAQQQLPRVAWSQILWRCAFCMLARENDVCGQAAYQQSRSECGSEVIQSQREREARIWGLQLYKLIERKEYESPGWGRMFRHALESGPIQAWVGVCRSIRRSGRHMAVTAKGGKGGLRDADVHFEQAVGDNIG